MPVPDLSLASLGTHYSLHACGRRLIINGKETSTIVYGDEIGSQFHFGNRHLLIARYECRDGASYWFCILDETCGMIDMASTPDYFGHIE